MSYILELINSRLPLFNSSKKNLKINMVLKNLQVIGMRLIIYIYL